MRSSLEPVLWAVFGCVIVFGLVKCDQQGKDFLLEKARIEASGDVKRAED